ncbi:MAG: ABC transporter substrate-binding protein [Dehalococcoidia bacterium]|nr:MAG: ABC transporter substrate-binding protein [Dehalococcoidia bacterium]
MFRVARYWLLALAILLAVASLALLPACEDEEEETPTPAASPEVTPGETPAVTPTVGGPLKIGLLGPLTGALAPFGPDYVNTANLALDHINAAGGVLGQDVELVVGDTGTAPEQGVAEARRLVDIAGVHAIVGAAASGVTLPIAESVTVPNKILQISNASTSPALTDVADDDYLFRTPISDAAQGVVLADLVEDLGFTSVCTMYVNNAYGQGLSENFAAAYTGTVTAQVSHTAETATTYASELAQCVEGDPEALLALSYPTGQADVYLKEAIEGAIIDQFVFCDGTKSDVLFNELGWEFFDGMQGTAPGALETEFGSTFDDAFEAKYGYIYQTPFNREAYDAIVTIALAAEKAGSTDPTAIRDALRDVANAPGEAAGPGVDGVANALAAVQAGTDIDYQGAAGSIEFDENGDILVGAIEIWRVDAASETLVTDSRVQVDLTTGVLTPIED